MIIAIKVNNLAGQTECTSPCLEWTAQVAASQGNRTQGRENQSGMKLAFGANRKGQPFLGLLQWPLKLAVTWNTSFLPTSAARRDVQTPRAPADRDIFPQRLSRFCHEGQMNRHRSSGRPNLFFPYFKAFCIASEPVITLEVF